MFSDAKNPFELNVINVIIGITSIEAPIHDKLAEKCGMEIDSYGIYYFINHTNAHTMMISNPIDKRTAIANGFQMNNNRKLLCNLSKAIKSKLDFRITAAFRIGS